MNDEAVELFDEEKHSPIGKWQDRFFDAVDADDPTPIVYDAYLSRFDASDGTQPKLSPTEYSRLMKMYYSVTATAKEKRGWTTRLRCQFEELTEKCLLEKKPSELEIDNWE